MKQKEQLGGYCKPQKIKAKGRGGGEAKVSGPLRLEHQRQLSHMCTGLEMQGRGWKCTHHNHVHHSSHKRRIFEEKGLWGWVFRFTRGSFGGSSRMLRLAYKGNTDLDCFGPVEGNGFFFSFLSCSQVYRDTVVSSLSLSHSLSSFLSLFFFFFLLWGIDGDESECTRIRPPPCEPLIANIRECLFPAVANASTIN